MNQIILSGRLCADPSMKYSATSNTPFATYCLAVPRTLGNKEDGKSETDFVECVSFGKSAEFAEKYLRKGKRILVTGQLQSSVYEGRDGQKRKNWHVIVNNSEFLDSKNDNVQNNADPTAMSQEAPKTTPQGRFVEVDDGDGELPF